MSEYLDDYEAAMDDLQADNARLQAIVDRLPKTADGVPAYEGMQVFDIEQNGSISTGLLMWWTPRGGHAKLFHHGGYRNRLGVFRDAWYRVEQCFSTREAAEAAKEGQP